MLWICIYCPACCVRPRPAVYAPGLPAVYPSSPLACYATSCTVACTVPLPMSLLCTYHTQLLKCGTYSGLNFCATSYVCIFWLNQRCNILLKPTFNRLITSNRLSSHLNGRATDNCSDTRTSVKNRSPILGLLILRCHL